MKLHCEIIGGQAVCYSTSQMPDAIPNGTRIVKQNSEPGDATPDGTGGVIIGSEGPILVPNLHPKALLLYFVVWDTTPDLPIGTTELKVRRLP